MNLSDYSKQIQKRTSLKFSKSIFVEPNRYVWHLTSKFGSNEKRKSISKDGLLPEKSIYGLVFVNNQITDPRILWPIPIDIYEFDCNTYSLESPNHFDEVLQHYDVWRIDTYKIPHIKWKIDPNLISETLTGNLEKPNDYLCTDQIIPPYCMTLFNSRKHQVSFRISELIKSESQSTNRFETTNLSPAFQNSKKSNWLKKL